MIKELTKEDFEYFDNVRDNYSEEEKEDWLEEYRINIKKENKNIINSAINLKLFTKEEYEKKYKNKYVDDKWGMDSFPQYIVGVIGFRNKKGVKLFVTTTKKLLDDRSELEKRFGLKIYNPKEALEFLKKRDPKTFKEMEKEMMDNRNYIG